MISSFLPALQTSSKQAHLRAPWATGLFTCAHVRAFVLLDSFRVRVAARLSRRPSFSTHGPLEPAMNGFGFYLESANKRTTSHEIASFFEPWVDSLVANLDTYAG